MVRIIKNILKDMVDQAWTLLGMFIAWVVIEGSDKTVVCYAIVWSLLIWLLSMGLRENNKEEKE